MDRDEMKKDYSKEKRGLIYKIRKKNMDDKINQNMQINLKKKEL